VDFELDFEKFVDDFVLFGYFVGNDFLPNLPTFTIREGALGILFDIYLKLLPDFGQFIFFLKFIGVFISLQIFSHFIRRLFD